MSKSHEEPDYSELSPEEANKVHRELPAKDRAICDQVEAALDRLRAVGKSTRRCDIRAEAGIGIDFVILYMGLLEAMEGPETSYAQPEPDIPSTVADVTADAKTNADLAEKRLTDSFRTALEEQSAKVARHYKADIEASRKTINEQRERIDDLRESAARLASETGVLRTDFASQTVALVDARAELDRANGQVTELTASNADLLTSNNALKDQMAALKTENADIRRMNEVLDNQLSESKHDRDMLKVEAEQVPGLRLEAAVLKTERDARVNEAANFRMMLKDAREDHALKLRGPPAAGGLSIYF